MFRIIAIVLIFLCLIHSEAFAAKKNKASNTQSGLPAKIAPPGERVFIFSPRTVSWGAYDATGNKINGGLANGGQSYCPDIKRSCRTPSGTFRIQSKGSASCKSKKYPIKRIKGQIVRGGAPMPFCMFFTDSGYGIHGTPNLTKRNASHGCIRVSNQAASWLSSSFINIGTKVKVLSY